MLALILMAMSTLISYNADHARPFTITFPKGAVEACTVYTSTIETIEQDGKMVPYAPKHCWILLDNGMTSYDDDWNFIVPNGGDWKVHADIMYEVIEHGGSTVKTISTPDITVKH